MAPCEDNRRRILVEFASAAEALRCALEVQGRLQDDEACRDMRLRIGLNLGEIIVDEDGDILATT